MSGRLLVAPKDNTDKQFFMSPFVQLLGKPPIMLPNMKLLSPEISLFPHHHQYLQKYMERNYYIKIIIGLACINY